MRRTVGIPTLFRTYCPNEYAAWGDREETVRRLIEQSGPMGKDISVYINQAARRGGYQHFPEVKFGGHLVGERGFPRTHVVYETYYISQQASAETKSASSLYLRNTQVLEQVFAPKFFQMIDHLYSRNSARVAKTRARLAVDLFAADPVRGTCGFWEVKKVSPTRRNTEKVQPGQELALAFIRYLADTVGPSLFRGRPYAVETALVTYVAGAGSSPSRLCTVTFEV